MNHNWKIVTDQHPVSPRRYFSLKLFRYVLSEYLLIVLWCIGIFLTLFIIGAIYDELEEFLKHDANIYVVVQYLLLLQPQYLINVIPISLLIAAVYVVSNLCRYNELSALRASGISLIQIGLPILCTGAACSVIVFTITEKVAPSSTRSAILLKRELSDPYKKRIMREKSYLAFRNKGDQRDWFFESFNANGLSYNVSVTQFRPDRSVAWELTAAQAEYRDGKWHFENLVLRRFDDEGYLLLEQPADIDLSNIPELNEPPHGFSFLFRLRPLEEFSALRIHKMLSNADSSLTPQTAAILETYFFYYLCLPFGCLLSTIIGVPLAVTQERSSATLNFILATTILALYYLFSQCFLVLGKSQFIPPLMAAITPLFVFTCIGLKLMKKKV